jgi:hypothetical protein
MTNKELETRISEVEKRLNICISKIYKDFLNENINLFHDGVMCFDDGILYDIETIEKTYTTLEFDRYAPEYIPIGNDNGDYELVMKSGRNVTRFGILEQGSIGTLKPEYLQNFSQWYKNGHSFLFDEEDDDVDWSKKVQVILKKSPENKTRTMVTIRKALMLDTPISELLSAADNTPCVLTDKHSAAVVKSIIEEYQLNEWLEIKF